MRPPQSLVKTLTNFFDVYQWTEESCLLNMTEGSESVMYWGYLYTKV